MEGADGSGYRVKHMEKMLWNNYKQEQVLQSKIRDIANTARRRMMELDRERRDVQTEFRLHKRSLEKYNQIRINRRQSEMAPTSLQHTLSIAPYAKGTLATKASSPLTVYVLKEYSKYSEVIPAILIHLNKRTAMTTPIGLDPEHDLLQITKEPDFRKITELLHSLRKLRVDIVYGYSKKLDFINSNNNISKYLVSLRKSSSVQPTTTAEDGDPYTDSVCVLIKRKIRRQERSLSMSSASDATDELSKAQISKSKIAKKPLLRSNSFPLETTERLSSIAPKNLVGNSSHHTGTRPSNPGDVITSHALLLRDSERVARSATLMEYELAQERVERELSHYSDVLKRIGTFMEEKSNV